VNAFQAEPLLRSSQARDEAWRCLQCFDAPCAAACPAGIPIPRFIRMIASGNVRGAAEVVRTANPLAHSCGVACPGEELCSAACVRARIDHPIEIRRLHRYATECEAAAGPRTPPAPRASGPKVAIVGAGPSGLACASELRRAGARVTIFEARDRVGGVLSSTIPLYRFPDAVAKRDAEWSLGDAAPRFDSPVRDVETLAKRFDAVYLAMGLVSAMPTLEGTHLAGVDDAGEFLARCRRSRYRNRAGRHVVVIGGGNVAIDAAMAAVRCTGDARVHLLYRRTRAEMPAWDREVREAEACGVMLHLLVSPIAFLGRRGRLTGVRLQQMRLGPPDADGRPRPVPVPGGEVEMPCDQAILATGLWLDPTPLGTLPITHTGRIRAHRKTGRVRGNIFAGGDAAGTDQTIVSAAGDGKRAARAILSYLSKG